MNKEHKSKDLAVGDVISKSEAFIEKNQKIILIITIAILLIVGGYFGYKKFIAEPHEAEAAAEMFAAENYFNKEDMDKALNGDGKHIGFLAIIDQYGSTPSGNLAKYYAGVAFMAKGEYKKAIEHLDKFSSKDMFVSSEAKALIGDCYMELNQKEDAIKYYQKALANPNDMTTPFILLKLGFAYEMQKDYKKALEQYKKIKTDFPLSSESREIDKYISRMEAMI
ncbi:MAG: tetratricopeptide repeat protein [Bacteroidales bacterium]|jgi:tetratricopeptide (TPR) repeat protein|nr:tetratricopeptide repeat protein [Bacteroidales bacterium]